jgi:hypothetical protein
MVERVPISDWDTRLEKKLDQLKDVAVDNSWYTGTCPCRKAVSEVPNLT